MGHNDFALFKQREIFDSSAIIGDEVYPAIVGPSNHEFRVLNVVHEGFATAALYP